jgi:hypothetical protein
MTDAVFAQMMDMLNAKTTLWKAYWVSRAETWASRCICGKLSQLFAGKELVSLACAKCSPDSVSCSETFARSFRRPT